MTDPIFQQLITADGLLGAFSMTKDGRVISSIGDFTGESADLHAPVILSILLDTKLTLDTKPLTRSVTNTNTGLINTNTGQLATNFAPADPLKRIVITYQSFTLSIVLVGQFVYVIKILNITDDAEYLGDEMEGTNWEHIKFCQDIYHMSQR